jgi:hypothetical protein
MGDLSHDATNSSSYLRALLAAALEGSDNYDRSCSKTVPSWSETPEFDQFAQSKSYDMLSDVHQLKDKLFCLERPGYAAGSFTGIV